jgi:hypothetical protein
MDNYDLLSTTTENEFLKNAIRWALRGLFQAIRDGMLLRFGETNSSESVIG